MSTLASMHIMHTPTYSTTTLHSSSTLRARSMQIMHITYAYSSSTVPEELFSRASMHTTLASSIYYSSSTTSYDIYLPG